jgi:1-acyl-sn-glycerol-3-phosphate acyltransferase
VLPWDGAMITTAVMEEHPAPRLVRNLFLTWFNELPFLAPLFAGLGQLVGVPDNAIHLLQEGHLVCTFPEGEKGVGKPFGQRYRLRRFGRNGFVKVALRTGAPLVPVAVVGAEEIYPLIGKDKVMARLFRFPFFPVTPFFPWLGPLGAIPLPTQWSITFCPPISTAEYGPDAADDPLVVFALSEQVRSIIQQTINERLAARVSIFA